MKAYAVELTGLLRVTAYVTADDEKRDQEVAWNSFEPREGETVTYSDRMECLEPDGPEPHAVYELSAEEFEWHETHSQAARDRIRETLKSTTTGRYELNWFSRL